MNEALRRELEKYFWDDDSLITNEKCEKEIAEFYEVYEFVKPLLTKEHSDKLENSFCEAREEYGIASFLHGYEYCLTMLGLRHMER